MKIRNFILTLLALASFSCEDDIQHEFTINEPIYMSQSEFKSAVKSEAPVSLMETGKIYLYKQYIFINEKYKGIHVYDNSDPAMPVAESFINIPGNLDLAIQNDQLYADSYTDLVVLDISNLKSIKEIKRFENVFAYNLPPTNNNYRYGEIDPEKGVVIGWKVKRTSEKYEAPRYYPMYDYMNFASAEVSGNLNTGSTGKAGSLARFIIDNHTLYTLKSSNQLSIYDITNPDQVIQSGNLYVGWGIETIFAYNNHLFFGANQGMYIYDTSNPLSPQFVSEYRHFMSCDPVVVDGDFAFITLRAGNFCGQNTSQLDIVDLTDLSSPELYKSISMSNPYGLGIDDDLLFVCDGTAGLKVYNKANLAQISLLNTFSEITPLDVIPYQDLLIAISSEGLFQYDYSDINNIQLLSSIPIPIPEN